MNPSKVDGKKAVQVESPLAERASLEVRAAVIGKCSKWYVIEVFSTKLRIRFFAIAKNEHMDTV